MRIRSVFVVLLIVATATVLRKGETETRHTEAVSLDNQLRPTLVAASAYGISPRLDSLQPSSRRPAVDRGQPAVKEQFTLGPINRSLENTKHDADDAIAVVSDTLMPETSLSFDGLANYDNISLYNLLILPPDPIGDVGPVHYVQAVNSAVRVFNKVGSPLTPPLKISDIFSTLGTVCATRNDGDPIVLYDTLADRWLISQYCTAFPPFRQMIGVSRTSDPTGEYSVYEFVMPNIRLNDFPKMGVWPDAYYMSTEEYFGADYVGSGAFAFDRTKLLAGDPTASYIYFSLPYEYPERVGGVLPADLDGLAPPPPGAPNIFIGYTANEYGDAGDAIRLFEFHADFAHPAASTFSERSESPVAVAPFDPTSPGGRADIRQPLPGESLDANSDRLMYRVAYRNFGGFESLVFNQTVRLTPVGDPYRAGIRLYELRRAGTSGFGVHQQLTHGDPSSSRWIGSAAQDNQGNLALGYNFVNDTKAPHILYSGRAVTDKPGTLRAEGTLATGTGVQKAFGFRWGDYSGMSVDPVDDCTFWMTGEYYTLESQEFSDFTWLTRIGKFKFPECSPAPKAVITGTVTSASTGQPVANSTVRASAYLRNTNSAGSYGDLAVIPGTYSLNVSAAGYRDRSTVVSVSSGETIVRNFVLEPIPVITNSSTTLTSESCSINGAAEPGETVAVTVPLRNTGRAAAFGVTVSLVRSGGITDPGPPQDYGTLPADGVPVARTFTFTVSPTIPCGSLAIMSLDVSVGAEHLGTVSIPLRAGLLRYAFRENFDSLSPPALPDGWSTGATGAQQVWRSTTARSSSIPNALYSPDPNQVGVNELISPAFPIFSSSAKLSFRNWYELETTFLRNRLYDGAVLEISLDGGSWQDILAAGGAFESGGYDGQLDNCCQNPLAGRMAWSGRSGVNQTSEFITSAVRLPASAAGRTARLRWRVATDIGTFREGQYIDDVNISDGYVCTCPRSQTTRVPFDFDGDARTDLSVFRPNDTANSPDFIIRNSSDNAVREIAWGSAGDIAANADFDGDSRTDLAVFRQASGTWYILRSVDLTITTVHFGLSGDRPVPSDFDGDGRADVSVYRPSVGTWFSLNSYDGQFVARQFGVDSDIPMPGDYDGDGKADITVFRPSTGVWYTARTSDSGYSIISFGTANDKPAAGDFDGDGRIDLAVFRPATGTWYMLRSKLGFGAAQFGMDGDVPLQADFDGDGMADIALFRPSTAVWYYVRSSDSAIRFAGFGIPGDIAVPSIYTGGI